MAKIILVLGLAFLMGACGGGPEKKPEDGTAPTDQPPPAEKLTAADNLLADPVKNQVLFDLDRLIDEWQKARAQRNPMAYASIERHIERKVDDNLPLLVGLAGDDGNPRGRLVASRALGFSPGKKARAALVGVLGSDDTALLENALMGLTLHPTEDLPADMIAGHLQSFEPRVQRNAALALYRAMLAGATLEPSVREGAILRLRVLLMDREHPMLRGNVAAALGMMGSSESENDLLNLLGDQDPYPRLKAIIALGRVGTRTSLMPLIQLLRAQETNIRAMASRALAAITDREGFALDRGILGEDPTKWHDAIQERMRREESRK